MLRPRGYGIERLRAAAAKSVDKANGELKHDFEDLVKDARLSCKYLGVDRDGTATPDVKAKKASLLHFDWHLQLHGYDENHAVTLRCDHACDRGAAFPEHWKTALRCVGFAKKAAEATSAARASSKSEHVDCSLLGLPKTAPVPIAGTLGVPGSVVALQTTGGMRQDYLLASQLDEDRWFCHRGSLGTDGNLDDDDTL